MPLSDEHGGIILPKAFSLWFFVAGVFCFAFYFLISTHPKYVCLLGWSLFSCSYFAVLAENYRNKPPVPALGRIIDYEKQRGLYKAIYVLLFVAGAFAVLVLLLVSIF
jgi:hypothetical protein